MKRLNYLFVSALVLLSLGITNNLSAQVTIKIVSVPKSTLSKDTIFLSGTINNWNAHDNDMQLIPQLDGSYSITLDPKIPYSEFKFTKGSWSTVEGDDNGYNISNRILNYNNSPNTIEVTIKSWMKTYVLLVDQVSTNTPQDASIYIMGAFNNWNPADPNYKFELLNDGTYKYVTSRWDSLNFKFTRGSILSIESNSNGQNVENRKFVPKSVVSDTIHFQIAGWEDLSNPKISFLELALFVSAFLGFFLCIGFTQMKNAKKEANKLLSVILCLIVITLILNILTEELNLHYIFPMLLIFPSITLFFLLAFLSRYIKVLLGESLEWNLREYSIFVIPIILFTSSLLSFQLTGENAFLGNYLNGDINVNFKLIYLTALFFNLYLLLKAILSLKTVKKFKGVNSNPSLFYYIKTLLYTGVGIQLLLLFGLAFSFKILVNTIDNQMEWVHILLNCCWLGVGIYPIIIIWFIIVHPNIFHLNMEFEKEKWKDSFIEFKAKLEDLMKTKKPFLNPELSIQDLSDLLQINTHTLSRIINDSSEMNFHDFINSYRIEEFKKRIELGHHKSKTIIAIANEVGFKSKATFNRTFKKMNEVTPRDFLHSIK